MPHFRAPVAVSLLTALLGAAIGAGLPARGQVPPLAGPDLLLSLTTRESGLDTGPGATLGVIRGVAFGPSGDLYAAGALGGGPAVVRVGRFTTRLGSGGGGLAEVRALAVDGGGRAWVTGMVSAAELDTVGTLQPYRGRTEAFVGRLNPEGVVDFLTYLGGRGDESGNAIALDAQGRAIVVGETSSLDFPVTVGAEQLRRAGRSDAFVAVIDASDRLAAATYLGGAGDDTGTTAAIEAGSLYVGGVTHSRNFPLRGPVPYQAYRGRSDGFLAELSLTSAPRLVRSTFLGGKGDDRIDALALSGGRLLAVGATTSTDFPLPDVPLRGDSAAFCVRFDFTSQRLERGHLLGGDLLQGAAAVVPTEGGRAWVTGYTRSDNFTTVVPLAGQGFLHTSPGRGAINQDAFLAKLDLDGPRPVLFSTYLRGAGLDRGQALAVETAPVGPARVAVGGSTTSATFPDNGATGEPPGPAAAVLPFTAGFLAVVGDLPASQEVRMTGFWDPVRFTCSGRGFGRRCRLQTRFTLRNQGLTDAPATVVRYVVSRDRQVSEDDFILFHQALPTVRSGRGVRVPIDIRGLPDVAERFLIAVPDIEGVLGEPPPAPIVTPLGG